MRHIISYQKLRHAVVLLLAMCAFGGHMANAADLSQEPLFTQKKLPPNVIFTLDNSGSMGWASLTGTDLTAEDSNTGMAKFYSSSYNGLYYNPAVYYEPPKKADGTGVPSVATPATVATAAMTAAVARIDGYSNTALKGSLSTSLQGNTVDLTTVCYWKATGLTLPLYTGVMSGNYHTNVTANTTNCKTSSTTTYNTAYRRYAFYYTYNGSTYTRVDIVPGITASYPKSTDRVDCTKFASNCTGNEELLNFSNWWSYYRTRINSAKAGTGLAFSDLDGTYRVGYGEINDGSSVSVDGTNNSTVRVGVRAFEDAGGNTYRTTWYQRLYNGYPSGSTPLRRAMDDVGQYYQRTDHKGPWGEYPGTGGGTQFKCRKNFHILMTDGYWNSTAAYTSGTSAADTTTTSYTWSGSTVKTYDASTATNLYKSSCSNTLADVAMYYWKSDLRPDWSTRNDKNVPVSDTDPAYWQHVTQYTVGLGVDGYKDNDNAASVLAGLQANTETWHSTCPANDNKSNVDDLWHAAVNGHGLYFNAKDPKTFRDSLSTALKDIAKVTNTASTETTSSSIVKSGTYQYTPSFTTNTWTGDLKAYAIDNDGAVSTTEAWSAANKLPAAASRNIVTMKDPATSTVVDFKTATDLSSSQQSALGADATSRQNMLNYLRGDGTNEKSIGGTKLYRDRAVKLGDIINASPLYVGAGTDQGYTLLPTGGGGYKTFKATKAARPAMLYVGANDGMMHAFRADTGVEMFAYVPASVYSNLSLLSSSAYSVNHRFFVDGQMTENDAYLSGWKTVLLGSTGAGAKSVFAIDITDPKADFSGLTASSVMWEKSDSGDSNMGNVLGDVRAAVLNNNTWVAVYGNGYHSSSGKSVLYLRNLSDGSAYKSVEMSAATGGLSTPALVYNKKSQLIGAYAGDLQGNLWKIDLSTPATPVVTKLFSGSSTQPITQRPAYKEHPQGGYMVMFGTGKYFDTGDNSSTDLQSIYGIWDKKGMVIEGWAENDDAILPFTKSANMRKNTLSLVYDAVATTTVIGASVVTSGTAPSGAERGWYADLTLNSGERIVTTPLVLDRSLIVKSLVPSSSDGCSTGGESFLYGLYYLTGGVTPNVKVFGTLNIVKLTSGGTAGIQIVQKVDGSLQVWSKSFDTKTKTDQELTNVVSPGFRTWRQLPVN